MLTLCQPIFKKSDGTEMNEDEIKQYVLNGGRLLLPTDEKISNPEDNQEKKDALRDYISLIQLCWKQEINNRPSFGEIISFIDTKFKLILKEYDNIAESEQTTY